MAREKKGARPAPIAALGPEKGAPTPIGQPVPVALFPVRPTEEARVTARGVHFALTEEQALRLMDAPDADNDTLLAFVEELEEGPDDQGWDPVWTQETDKAWDAIHRCLTDGKLKWGRSPYHDCILGRHNLYEGDEYLMSFLEPDEVKEVAAAIQDIDRDEFRRQYDPIHVASYGELSDSDFEYPWGWFVPLRDLFQRAAEADRAVLFTVDL
jgi:hypothetical protein